MTEFVFGTIRIASVKQMILVHNARHLTDDHDFETPRKRPFTDTNFGCTDTLVIYGRMIEKTDNWLYHTSQTTCIQNMRRLDSVDKMMRMIAYLLYILHHEPSNRN